MGDEIDWSVGETGYDSDSQGELDDYLQSGGYYANDVVADDGTTAGINAQIANLGSSGLFSSSDLVKLFKDSPLLQTLGAAGMGKLADKLFDVQKGPGGYGGGIPTLTAYRQQYAVPTTGIPSTYNPSDTEIRDYALRPGINDAMVARGMNQFGVSPERMAGIMQLPVDQVQSRYQAAMGPNMVARRPGSGGVTYFSPMQYLKAGQTPAGTTPAAPVTPAAPAESVAAPVEVAAAGGLMGYARGGIANLGGYSDGGRLLKGPGDGVSDSIPAVIGKRQPARLADGEFVIPARIVSELGNGSTEAGARKLYAMMDRIKKARGKAKNIAADTKSDKHLPA
jgi:hypothetical protein